MYCKNTLLENKRTYIIHRSCSRRTNVHGYVQTCWRKGSLCWEATRRDIAVKALSWSQECKQTVRHLIMFPDSSRITIPIGFAFLIFSPFVCTISIGVGSYTDSKFMSWFVDTRFTPFPVRMAENVFPPAPITVIVKLDNRRLHNNNIISQTYRSHIPDRRYSGCS